MAERISFVFYHEFAEYIAELSGDEAKELMLAVIDYDREGIVPSLKGAAKMAFIAMALRIDKDRESWEDACRKRREAGKLGGAPKGNKNAKTSKTSKACKNKQSLNKQAKQADIDLDIDIDLDLEDQEIKTSPPCCSPTAKTPKKKPEKKADLPDVDAYNFSPVLRPKIDDWLKYKKEMGKEYKAVGLKSLLTEISNNAAKYGDQAVAGVIETSMSNLYQGIVFDRLKQSRAGPGSAKPTTWGKDQRKNKFADVADDDL
jgi:hypothetical protein